TATSSRLSALIAWPDAPRSTIVPRDAGQSSTRERSRRDRDEKRSTRGIAARRACSAATPGAAAPLPDRSVFGPRRYHGSWAAGATGTDRRRDRVGQLVDHSAVRPDQRLAPVSSRAAGVVSGFRRRPYGVAGDPNGALGAGDVCRRLSCSKDTRQSLPRGIVG